MAGGIISEEEIEKVREASDLVTLIGERSPVKQRGHDFWCCCPLHNEKTPSFKIDPVKQLWHCFGCGEGGDVFGYVMKTEDLSFPEAVRKLADRAHIPLSESGGRSSGVASSYKERLKAVCAQTADFYHRQLMRNPEPRAAEARAYLSGRGLGGDVPKSWQLGFAPGNGQLVRHLSSLGFKPKEMVDANVGMEAQGGSLRDRFYNRVMFPINDAQGECIAFGGRVVGKGEPKYLNSQETPIFHKSQVLYGLDHAKSRMAATGVAVVVEGYTDVIAMHEAGIGNAVATLGTALTMKHIRVLSRHARKIVYLFDGDEAGQRAADRALGFIDGSMTPEAGRSRVELCAVTLPDNLDPADFIEARGAEAMQVLIDGAQPLLKYGIDRRLAGFDLSGAEGRARALAEALSVLAPIKDSALARDYAVQIASRVRAREEDVLEQLSQLQPPRRSDQRDEEREAVADGRPAAGGGAQDVRPAGPALTQGEVNRRRFEREFLSLMAQNPAIALQHADVIAQTQWHDRAHAALAQSMLSTLSDDPSASAARIVTEASRVLPAAPGILTSGSMASSAAPASLAAFLVEELAIGDAEDAVDAMRAQMADPASLDPDEFDMLFQTVSAMQKDLSRRKLAHKPLSSG